MHLLMIVTTVTLACWLRSSGRIPQGNWHLRWQKTLFLFLFPPLLILMTAISIVCMGTQGTMGGMYTSSFSYLLGLIFLGFLNILGIKLAFKGYKSIESARECPHINLAGKQVRLLQTEALFAGQMGFWQPELVVSQGLLAALSPVHLESVLAHEQGHYQYRDFGFFGWVGCVPVPLGCLIPNPYGKNC
jgi:Zn-dependent protease with chaperone function